MEQEKAPLTLAELDEIRAYYRRHVTQRAAFSGAIAAVPLPFVDAAADLGILMRLLPKISAEFDLSPQDIARQDAETKAIIYTTAKKLGNSFIGQATTKRVIAALLAKAGVRVAGKSAAKFAPVVGQAAAASISFALMRQIGLQHVEDCYRIARARSEMRLFGVEGMVVDGVVVHERA